MNTSIHKFNELKDDNLYLIVGGEGDFTRGMHKLGRAVRGVLDSTGKFICKYAPWC